MLDVAVNLTWMTAGRVGGSEEYLVRLLTGIASGSGAHSDDDDLRLRLYCHPTFTQAYPELSSLFETHALPVRRDSRPLRIAAEHTWLLAKTRSADVIHHGGGTMPLLSNRPVLLTVHDLQYLRFPQYFSASRRKYLHALMPRSVRRAAFVATPSEYVRSTVIDAFDIDPNRVVVVRHGLPEIERPTEGQMRKVRAKYHIDGPYLAFAAITHPHKGHRTLVDLMASTTGRDHPLHGMKLVLLGGEGAAEADVRAAIERSGCRDRIIRTGRVPANDRDALIAGAEVLAFPSEYEGFGAPLIEAMALDTPVVASDHPAVAEVVADSGRIVESTDADAWTDHIVAALDQRDELVRRGRQRRAEFTIERSGLELGNAYRLTATTPGRASR